MNTIPSLRTVLTAALLMGATGVLRAAPTPVANAKEKSQTHAIMPAKPATKSVAIATSSAAAIPANISKVFSEAAHGGVVSTIHLVNASPENYYRAFVTSKDNKIKSREVYVSLSGVMLDQAPTSHPMAKPKTK